VFLAMGLGAAGLAYRDGPPPDRTGGFGGGSCHACHADNPVNAAGGSLQVTGVPERYEPGRVYRITVTLERAGLSTAGFQITARTTNRAFAGTWRALDDRAGVVDGFAQQTSRGARAPGAEGVNRWELEWTAPAAPVGDVLFHAAANASNDDASALGDFIYLGEWKAAGP
jgi:hypothetical protein